MQLCEYPGVAAHWTGERRTRRLVLVVANGEGYRDDLYATGDPSLGYASTTVLTFGCALACRTPDTHARLLGLFFWSSFFPLGCLSVTFDETQCTTPNRRSGRWGDAILLGLDTVLARASLKAANDVHVVLVKFHLSHVGWNLVAGSVWKAGDGGMDGKRLADPGVGELCRQEAISHRRLFGSFPTPGVAIFPKGVLLPIIMLLAESRSLQIDGDGRSRLVLSARVCYCLGCREPKKRPRTDETAINNRRGDGQDRRRVAHLPHSACVVLSSCRNGQWGSWCGEPLQEPRCRYASVGARASMGCCLELWPGLVVR